MQAEAYATAVASVGSECGCTANAVAFTGAIAEVLVSATTFVQADFCSAGAHARCLLHVACVRRSRCRPAASFVSSDSASSPRLLPRPCCACLHRAAVAAAHHERGRCAGDASVNVNLAAEAISAQYLTAISEAFALGYADDDECLAVVSTCAGIEGVNGACCLSVAATTAQTYAEDAVAEAGALRLDPCPRCVGGIQITSAAIVEEPPCAVPRIIDVKCFPDICVFGVVHYTRAHPTRNRELTCGSACAVAEASIYLCEPGEAEAQAQATAQAIATAWAFVSASVGTECDGFGEGTYACALAAADVLRRPAAADLDVQIAQLARAAGV